ncbi:MAG: mechanosensitive ion channel family protein [Bacilli bacterium]
MLNVYFANVGLNWGLSIAVVVFLIALFLLEAFLFKKKDLKIKQWLILTIYIVNFILVIGAIFALIYFWNDSFIDDIKTFFNDFGSSIEQSISHIIWTIVTVFVSAFVLKVLRLSLRKYANKQDKNKKRKMTIAKISSSIILYTGLIIAGLIILAIWGVNVVPALAGLGIVGIVVGLGAQKFINDLISGFFIVFEQHYDVGDVIEVDGFKGTVTDIGLKTTRIKGWKGDVKIISNGNIESVINYSKNDSVAIIDFGIAYKEDVDKVTALLNKELPALKKDFPQIKEVPQVIGVMNLNTSSVDMRVIALCKSETHYAVERAVRQKIKEVLDVNNIEIPFPQVVVHESN